MSRPLRIEYPGAWYHVMNRGLARRNIFRIDKDKITFLELLEETSETYQIEIHAFSLMDNHYHLLIHTPHGGLSRAMRHLDGVYTQRVNKRWKSDGPIFRGRYKAVLVDSDEYLLELVRYIHVNPVEARLCGHPKEHKWTSHIHYVKKAARLEWLITNEVLNYFGKREKESIKKLDDFVCEGVPDEFRKAVKEQGAILGDKGFKEWVRNNFMSDHKEKKGIPIKDRKPKPRVPMKLILESIGHAFAVPVRDIRKAKSGSRNDARSMAVYLARKLNGASQRDIALWLHASSEQAVAQMQRRFKQRLEQDKKMVKMTDLVSQAILNTVKP